MADQQSPPESPPSPSLQRAFAARIRQRFLRGLWVRVAIWAVGLLLLFAAGFWVYMYLTTMQGYYIYKTVDMNPTIPRFDTGDGKLFVLSRGDSANPPVLVVHDGPGWDMHGMEPLNALTDSFRVVYYDQRGTGQSQRLPREKLTFKHHLQDLDTLSKYFASEQPVRLVGQGWGSLLIASYLAQYETPHVHSAVMMAPPDFTAYPAQPLVQSSHGLAGIWTDIEASFIHKHIWIKGDAHAADDYTMMYYDRRHLPRDVRDSGDTTVPIFRAGAQMRGVVDSLSEVNTGWYQTAAQQLKQSTVPIKVIVGEQGDGRNYRAANAGFFSAKTEFETWSYQNTAYPLNTSPGKARAAIRAYWHTLADTSRTAKEPQPAAQ